MKEAGRWSEILRHSEDSRWIFPHFFWKSRKFSENRLKREETRLIRGFISKKPRNNDDFQHFLPVFCWEKPTFHLKSPIFQRFSLISIYFFLFSTDFEAESG
jgi:hypothetical protein